MTNPTFETCMSIALEEARQAYLEREVPVGAVLVDSQGAVLARNHNRTLALQDATAHAELLCIQEGCKKLGGRLVGCTLFVTMEPCPMCAGAAVNAKLTRLVFGAYDTVSGCCGSVFDLTDHCFLHTVETWGGILEKECANLLTGFFSACRTT